MLIDAVVHAVNKDYSGMAEDFIKLGFLAESKMMCLVGAPCRLAWSPCRDVSSVWNHLVPP